MLLIRFTISLHFFDSFAPLLVLCIYSAYSSYFALRLSEYIMINCCRLLLLDKYRDPRKRGDDSFTLPTPRENEIQ